jgi:hypothetical protein
MVRFAVRLSGADEELELCQPLSEVNQLGPSSSLVLALAQSGNLLLQDLDLPMGDLDLLLHFGQSPPDFLTTCLKRFQCRLAFGIAHLCVPS